MAISPDDVRHVAELARLRVPDERLAPLVGELNRILEHMEVLHAVDTGDVQPAVAIGDGGTPLREDTGPPIPLALPREEFAPAARDGFFIVPRLATHEDEVEP